MATKITHAEWLADAERRFGKQARNWKFVCPICGNVASLQEFKDAGAKDPSVGVYQCIGRYRPPQGELKRPCDYTLYGLLNLAPFVVLTEGDKEHYAFAFADADPAPVIESPVVAMAAPDPVPGALCRLTHDIKLPSGEGFARGDLFRVKSQRRGRFNLREAHSGKSLIAGVCRSSFELVGASA